MKYDVQFTNQFKRDVKLAKKQGKDLEKLYEIIDDVLVLMLNRTGSH